MRNTAWAKSVDKPRISLAKAAALYTPSTATMPNHIHRLFFVRILDAAFARAVNVFTQAENANSYLVGGWLYSFSTVPNKASNKLLIGLIV